MERPGRLPTRVRQPKRYARTRWWPWCYWGIVVVLVTTCVAGETQERCGGTRTSGAQGRFSPH